MITNPIIVLAALTGDAEGQHIRSGPRRSLQWNSVIADDDRRCSDYCGFHGHAYYWCHVDTAKEGGDKNWSYCGVDYGDKPTTEPTDVRSVREGVYSRRQWATDKAQTQKEVMITTSRAGGVYALDPQDPSNILGCFLPRADDKLVQDTNRAGYMKFEDAARDFTKGGGEVCPLDTHGVIAFEGQSRLGNVFVASSICRDSKISGSPACPNVGGTDTPMLYVWFNLEATLGSPDKIIPLMGTDPTWRWRASLHVDLGTVKRGEWEYMIAGVSNGFEYFKNPFMDTDGVAAVTIARRKAGGANNQFQGLSSTDEFPINEDTKADFESVDKAIVRQYNFYSAMGGGGAFDIVRATEGTAVVPIQDGDRSRLFLYTAAVNGLKMAGSEIEIDDNGYVEKLKTPVQVPHGGFESEVGIKQQVSRSFIANDGKTRIIVSSNFQGYGFVMKYKVNAAADENGNMLTYLGAGAVRTDGSGNSGANRVILFRVPKKTTNGQQNPQYCTYAVIPFKKPAVVGIFDVTSSGDEEQNLEAVKKVKAVQITGETIYALEVVPTGASRTHATAEEGQGGLHTFSQDESGYVSFNVLAPLHSAEDKTMRTIQFKLRLCQDGGPVESTDNTIF